MNHFAPLYIDPNKTVRIRVKETVPGTPQDAYVLLRGITVFGVTYDSVQEAASALEANEKSVIVRLREMYRETWKAHGSVDAHPTLEQINTAFVPGYIIVRGKVFHSKMAAARYYKLPTSYVQWHLKKLPQDAAPEDIDAIFDRVAYMRRRHDRRFYAKGHGYRTMNQACKAHGVDQQTVIRKLRTLANPTQEQIDALFDPPDTHTRNPEPITVKGVQYRSITAACRALGMRQNTVDGRLKRIPERSAFWIDACFMPGKMPRAFRYTDWKNNITVRGQLYPSIEDAANTFGVHSPTVRKRLARLPEWVAQVQIDECFCTD